MKITGTFLDEITHDIPSANWGRKEWSDDFDAMQSVGIDTVILIRCGYKNRITYPSKYLATKKPIIPSEIDLVDLFLTEAEKRNMKFYFGIYDSGEFWNSGLQDDEIEQNLHIMDEVAKLYADRKAFQGWYMSHELSTFDENTVNLYTKLVKHAKGIKDIPVLISPFIIGRKQFDKPITPDDHERQWDEIFSRFAGLVDTVAFQDGQVDFFELSEFMDINVRLAKKHGLTPWSNVESFERGMPLNFLPIAFPHLKHKIGVAEKAGIKKCITFEFSHFMSPNSMYPSARNLFNRYKEWIEGK